MTFYLYWVGTRPIWQHWPHACVVLYCNVVLVNVSPTLMCKYSTSPGVMSTKNVKQVTWQRVSEQKSENMATYSERFGATVTGPFRENVNFVETGLQQCSIVIKGIQWSDESCYMCLFNVFPDGAISGRTCLKIYVNVSDDRILSLSCSVTGRPAPEVSWSIEDTALENSTTFYTKNPNGTITVTKTATVQMTPRLLANTTQIKCAAQQDYGERKETFITVPNGETADNQSDKADKDDTSDTGHTVIFYTVLAKSIHDTQRNVR
uniref:Ig-like domain-containing protein n=1 Tax=Paramormyrops kingsleyae TaxID=1676925 RepID=A0A3B3SGC1_9TELE